MTALSIRTKLILLFAALVVIPLVAAVAWLGVTAHRSVLKAGRELTGVVPEQRAWHAYARLSRAF